MLLQGALPHDRGARAAHTVVHDVTLVAGLAEHARTRVLREGTDARRCKRIGESTVARHHGGAPCAAGTSRRSEKRRRACAQACRADASGVIVDPSQREGLGKVYCDSVVHGRRNPNPAQPAARITADRNGVRDESPLRSCRPLRNAGNAAALRARTGPALCGFVASSAHLSLMGRGALPTGSRAASLRNASRPRPCVRGGRADHQPSERLRNPK